MTSTVPLDRITLDRPRYATCTPRCLTRCACRDIPGQTRKGAPAPVPAPRASVLLREGDSVNLTTGVVTRAGVAPRRTTPGAVDYVRRTPRRRPAVRTVDGVTFTPGAVAPAVPTGPTVQGDRRSLRIGDALPIRGAWWVVVARPDVDTIRVVRPIAAAVEGAPLDPFAPHPAGTLSRVVTLPVGGVCIALRRAR